MVVSKYFAAAAIATGLSAAPAHAQIVDDDDWFAQVGVTQLSLRDSIELRAGGMLVPGADIKTKTHYTPSVSIGRFVGRNVAVGVTLGIPPKIKIKGKGSLEPFGLLAETTYGPTALTVQYHPNRGGRFQPYVGAGVTYMIIFDADDASFQDVTIEDDLAPVLQAGANYMFTPKVGAFLDVKKGFLRTTARGTFNNIPIEGDVKLDPWVVSAGGVFTF
jgi:outer membrane protein